VGLLAAETDVELVARGSELDIEFDSNNPWGY
jgi:hypothetical protein